MSMLWIVWCVIFQFSVFVFSLIEGSVCGRYRVMCAHLALVIDMHGSCLFGDNSGKTQAIYLAVINIDMSRTIYIYHVAIVAVIEPTASFHDGSEYSLPRRKTERSYEPHTPIQEEEVRQTSSSNNDNSGGMPDVQ